MSPNSEIEEMIRIAAERKSPDDERRLFSALGRVKMYFARALVEHEGRTVNAFPLLRLPDGSNAMLLCTDKAHPDLPILSPEAFSKTPWEPRSKFRASIG